MPRNVSNAFKQAVFAQQTSEAFILLATISHPSFTDDIRVASDPYEDLPIAGVKGVISDGLEYVYLPFTITLPAQNDTGIARASISIDNVNREIVNAVRRATSALEVSMQVVRASDVNTPEVLVSDFRLERITYDALTVSGEITVEYYDLEPFPSKRFTPSDFPGMF